MERSDLLDLNGQIFQMQGQALNEVANPDCKVVVVGNPCNTNALIAMENAPNLKRKNFHALTRLDQNRARSQLAVRSNYHYASVKNVCIWGNHSTTQVPDFVNATIDGEPAEKVIDNQDWLEEEFTPLIQTRGAAVIKKWGRSSGASTAVSKGDGDYEIIEDFEVNDYLRAKLVASEEELVKEKNCVKHLMGEAGGYCDPALEDTMLPGEN